MVQPSFDHPREAQSTTIDSTTRPLDEFLDGESQAYYEELYKSEAACLCILRLLPPVARHIILHHLWTYNPIRTVDLKAFCQVDPGAKLEILDDLVRPAQSRQILHPIRHKKNHMEWPFNDTFKTGLRNALTGLGTSNAFGVPLDHPGPNVEELMAYGENTWESILKYMVSSGLSGALRVQKPKEQVLRLLQRSGLMITQNIRDPNSLDRLTITSKGFQFLLEDRQTQLWQILMYYLKETRSAHAKAATTLSTFFTLGCMQLGQGYSASESFPHALSALDDLESYGFIYKSPDHTDLFFPTHLATSLCSGHVGRKADKRFLILETNYKIYAYTHNELEIAILNLFVDIRIRYPNLVVGKLDRAHVKAAMEKGISAAQIISYLGSHAHAQMYTSPPPLLHPTIVDQLHLWDRERNRLKAEDAVMFEFFSKDMYEDTKREAETYGGLLHAVPASKHLFVDPTIKDSLKLFISGQQAQFRQ